MPTEYEKQIFVSSLKDIDSQIYRLQEQREQLKKDYVKRHMEFNSGERVEIEDKETGKIDECFVSGANVYEGNGTLYYGLRKPRNDGSMSLHRYSRPDKYELHKLKDCK